MAKIYVKISDVPKTKTRKDLIRKFLRGKSIPTYENEQCTKLQCDGKGEDTKVNAFRSITDLHAIVQSRFPVTSLKAVVKIIYEIIGEESSVVLVFCNMIQKVVVKYQPNSGAKWMSEHSRKHFFTTKGVDGYSLEDFEGIKDSL
jgi:hypothetical protein